MAADRRAAPSRLQTPAPGGRLFIIGQVLNDDRRTPAHTALFNLIFLNVYDAGVAHTEGEHRQWLAAAELMDVK